MKLAIVLFLAMLISCAGLPPQKDFVTELYQLNFGEGRIERLNDDDEIDYVYFEDMVPGQWVVVETEDIKNEWKYEKLLIKSCESWR